MAFPVLVKVVVVPFDVGEVEGREATSAVERGKARASVRAAVLKASYTHKCDQYVIHLSLLIGH